MFPNQRLSTQYYESSFLNREGSGSGGGRVPRPKMVFPAFAGERPKSWKRQCESDFRVFDIQSDLWVDTTTMHFSGGAQLWLENPGLDVENLSWSELCALVCDQFGRDEFQKLLRQLFHLKQIGSVVDYIQEFTEVMHALKAHTSNWDPELFPSRFVDGLKDEIRVVVLVHQPKDLDSAVSLALLQEEAMEILKKREPWRTEGPFQYSNSTYRALANPVVSGDKQAALSYMPCTPSLLEDKRGQESARSATPATTDEHTSALKAYRRARGLCFICGEKWVPGHKCATTVQLHVVQEMLDALGLDSMEESLNEGVGSGELLMISQAAVAGTEAPNTFRLLGQIQKQQMLMLVDSGSCWPETRSADSPSRLGSVELRAVERKG